MNVKKNIPNFLTLCNLLCGCIALVFAFEGNLIWSAYMVGMACVFDFLDGLVARALNVHSEIGKQLDSLADMVSFGVVPGVMMFQMINCSLIYQIVSPNQLGFPPNFEEWSAKLLSYDYKPFIAFLIPIFSAIRLAKFNLDMRQTDSFIGLPTPANSIFISSLPLVIPYFQNIFSINSERDIFEHMTELQSFYLSSNPIGFLTNPYFLFSVTIISSILLIAPLPLFALKFKNFSWADNKVRYIFLALALVLLIVFQFAGIPLIIILYIILSIINNLTSKKTVL